MLTLIAVLITLLIEISYEVYSNTFKGVALVTDIKGIKWNSYY